MELEPHAAGILTANDRPILSRATSRLSTVANSPASASLRKSNDQSKKMPPAANRTNQLTTPFLQMTPDSATSLAISTHRIPENPNAERITAIVKLTPERAGELISLMNEIANLATVSSRVFKVSSFEPRVLYVPSRALRFYPQTNDFLVLPSTFEVTAVAQVKLVHADVLPFAVSWQAYDLNNRFILTTTEISAVFLQAIASGASILPSTTRENLLTSPTRARVTTFLNLPKYTERFL